MKQYHIFYGNEVIGMLRIDNNQYQYEAYSEAIQKLQAEPLHPILLNSIGWSDDIPFFRIRLEANQRFDNLGIGFLTDKVRIKEIEN